MLKTVRMLRRLLRNALLVTKRVKVMPAQNSGGPHSFNATIPKKGQHAQSRYSLRIEQQLPPGQLRNKHSFAGCRGYKNSVRMLDVKLKLCRVLRRQFEA